MHGMFQAELDLDKVHRDAMYSLPSEKKWQIYCSKKKVGLTFYVCIYASYLHRGRLTLWD